MAKDRDTTIRGGPEVADVALPPEATSGRRADPSLGRIRLLSLPSSARRGGASAGWTSVRAGLREALGEAADVVDAEALGEDERQRVARRARLAPQPRQLGLLGADTRRRGACGVRRHRRQRA